MKKCISCGAEIPIDAIYCDVCGAPVLQSPASGSVGKTGAGAKKKPRGLLLTLVMAAVFGFVILVVVALISGAHHRYKYEEYDRRRDLTGWEETITPEEYENLKTGMTYEEVKEVIGGEGKLIEDEKYWISYRWPGEYYYDKYSGYIELSFNKPGYGEDKNAPPKLDHMSENEIVGGKEASETNKMIEERNYSAISDAYVTRAQVSRIEAGMTYEQVCELLETEGRLLNSKTYTTAYRTDKYEEYAWKCKNNERDAYFSQTFEDGVVKEVPTWTLEYID